MAVYKYVKRKHHPLSTPSGRIPEHRVILYDDIGPGPHPCHHCGTEVDWMPGRRTSRGALVVDHLDDDTTNNARENLAPSCHPCNFTRTDRSIGDDEQYLVIEGRRVRAVERTCEECSATFLHRATVKDPRRGRFCSRSCARKQPRNR